MSSLLNLINIFGNITKTDNATSNTNNTGFDWSSIFDDTSSKGSSIINNIIDWITGNNKNNETDDVPTTSDDGESYSIKSRDLNVYYDTTTSFKVNVLSGNKPVTNNAVVFTINNNKYPVNVDSNGVATLKLTLKPGTYSVTSTCGDASAKNTIIIKKSIITKNVSKKYKKTKKYTVKVLKSTGKPHAKLKVKLKIKGKTYSAKTNSKGIATFKLPKNLKVGKYTMKTTCKGLTVSNKLTVKR